MKAEVPGKLVIQDRPEVIAIAENSAAPEIIKMPHDYFTEEPVKGTDRLLTQFTHASIDLSPSFSRCSRILLAFHHPRLAGRGRTKGSPCHRPRHETRLLQDLDLRCRDGG